MRMIFPLFLLLSLIANGYVAWRVWHVVPLPVWGKWVVAVVIVAFLACLISAVAGWWDTKPMWMGSLAYDLGGTWTIIFLYLFMAFAVLDIGHAVNLVPGRWLNNNLITTCVLAAAVAGLLIYGNAHYNNKVRETLSLTTGKRVTPDGRSLKVVLISDIHLGYHNRRAELSRWVDLLNAEHPDLILVAGDIIDGLIRPVTDEGDAEEFRRIGAPVVACLGNHEYLTGIDKAIAFYREAGITLLRDSTFTMGGLTVIGRDDRSNPDRKALADLLSGVPRGQYTIVLDHQPNNLAEAERSGVDFQFSGHTHQGQVWPVSLLTDGLFEDSYGPWQRGGTRYYVSSGLGIWGGKYRIGTQSEYVVATIGRDVESE